MEKKTKTLWGAADALLIVACLALGYVLGRLIAAVGF